MSEFAKWNSQRDVWERPEAPIFGPLDVYSATFPTSGSMRNGVVYELPTWERPTAGSASSSLLPTPVASEGIKATNRQNAEQKALTGQVWLTNVLHTIRESSGVAMSPLSAGGKHYEDVPLPLQSRPAEEGATAPVRLSVSG